MFFYILYIESFLGEIFRKGSLQRMISVIYLTEADETDLAVDLVVQLDLPEAVFPPVSATTFAESAPETLDTV